MNKRNLQQWELRLGIAQVVVLLGIITGSIACAFYVGFSSGRGVGFEAALEKSLAHTARFPIAGELASPSEEGVSEVYAKLNANTRAEAPKEIAAEPMPGLIKSTDSMDPVAAVTGKKQVDTTAVKDQVAVNLDSLFPSGVGKVDDTSHNGATTLGALAEKAKPVVEEQETAKSVQAISAEAKNNVREELKAVEAARVVEKTTQKATKPSSEAPVLREPQKNSTSKSPIITAKTAVVRAGNDSRPTAPSAKISTKAADKSVVRQVLPVGWFAQVAAPRKMQDAMQLVKQLKGSGFSVMIESAQVRGEEYFRVIVGPEQTRQQADRLVEQIRRERYIQGEPFIRVVK